MQIELYIDGEQKVFTTPFVPMLARRKYLEIEARAEERKTTITTRELIEEDNEILSILCDIVFKGKFTLEQLYEGASKEYLDKKVVEMVFGKPKTEGNEGNEKGE